MLRVRIMCKSRRFLLVVACLLNSAACSDGDSKHGTGRDVALDASLDAGRGGDMQATVEDASNIIDGSVHDGDVAGCDACIGEDASSESPQIKICDGTDNIRVLASRSQTGKLEWGAGELYQNDLPLLLVDGQCRLFLLRDEWSELRSKRLSVPEEMTLSRALNVNAWTPYEGTYCNYAYDGSIDLYWVSGAAVRDAPCMNGPELPPALAWSAVAEYLSTQYETGAQVDAALWYTLVPGGSPGAGSSLAEQQFHGGEPWPVAGDPKDLSPASARDPVTIHRAEGADADVLRGLRQKVLNGEIGRKQAVFIPIVQADGKRYELRIRDATPFDDENGPTLLISSKDDDGAEADGGQ